jgi:hypothetical protein
VYPQLEGRNEMIVTFTTKTYPDITMFGNVALTLLKMMGHSTKVPGAILAEDVPSALARLRAAIDALDEPPADEDDEDGPSVSLAHRALPLIELLEAADAEDANVMWK